MKDFKSIIGLSILVIVLIQACGPTEEELRQQEQARLDSLQRVQIEQLEQARIDSVNIAQQQAEQQALAEAERRNITYSSEGPFSVQVGSWRSEEKANEMIAKWKSNGFENAYSVMFGSEETGDVWFRVRLGNVATIADAEKIQALVKEDFEMDSWIDQI
ncbi:MAG TPA: SPOR domain-containing protein [Bacteroidetes bacterium]|nr:SPOR domain-containing protein [Bacteroidota bacterium]